MTKITNIGKPEMIALRPEINAALVELGERFGLKFHAGNGSFGGAEASFKLTIAVDDPEIQNAKKADEFNRYCSMFGLEPSDLGTEFRSGMTRYQLVGLELKRRKFPIRVLNIGTGKEVLLTELAVPAIRAAAGAK